VRSEPQNPDASSDVVERLVVQCLEAGGESPRSALELVCAEHPDYADELRARLALIEDYGFLDVAAADPPRRFGDFTLIRKLGQGGFGVVYLARQESLGRRVVLKLLRNGIVTLDEARVRFEREVQATARLEHAGVCSLLEAGEVDGVPYLATQYVPGETLEDKLRRAQRSGTHMEIGQVIAWGIELARALHAAHEAGLVHRDVKPGNVLIDRDNRALLLDFGLARLLDDADGTTVTRSGEAIGTPAYMAPEQILGQPVDRRTDVYALGVLLYECLALQCPFEGVSRRELEQQILTGHRRELVEVRRRVPRDLSTVIGVAMDRDASRRYANALELGDDLERASRGEPIRARAAGVGVRLERWCRRNRVAALILIFLTTLVTVSGTLLWQLGKSLEAAENLAVAGLARDMASTDPVAALVSAREAYERSPSPTTLSALYDSLAASHEQQLFEGHKRELWRAKFSGDGRYLVTCSDDWTARIWDTWGKEQPRQVPHGDSVVDVDTHGDLIVTAAMDGQARLFGFDPDMALRLAPLPEDRTLLQKSCLRARFSHDGKTVLITSFGGLGWLWHIEDDTVQTLRGHDGLVWHGCFSPDDRLVLTVVGYGGGLRPFGKDVTARIWSRDGVEVARLAAPERGFLDAAFSPDGRFVLTGADDGMVRLFDLGRLRATEGQPRRYEPIEKFRLHKGPVRCVCFHPDGELFASAALDGTARISKLDGAFVACFKHDGAICSMEFSADGTRLLTAGWDMTARVHDLHGRLLRTLRGHSDQVMHATFSPNGEWIATASYDHTARLWRADDPEFGVHVGHTGRVRSVAVAPDGSIGTGSADGSVIRWGPNGARVLSAGFRVNRVAFSPSGASLAAARGDQAVVVWSQGRAPVVRWVTDKSWLQGIPPWRGMTVAFLDEHRMLVGTQDGAVRVLDTRLETWSPDDSPSLVPADFAVRHAEIADVSIHPSGRLIAVAGWAGAVSIRDLSGNEVASVDHGRRRLMRVEFSPVDGDLLLTASRDGLVNVWNWRSSNAAVISLPHEPAVTWACFSPDGHRVLTTAMDGSARIWSLTGDEMLVIHTGPEALWCGAWSPDGKRIVTGDDKGLVRSWPVDPDHIVELAHERGYRTLRPETAARVDRIRRR